MLKENSKAVFNYVKAHDTEDITAKDIAAALGKESRSVNGTLTALQRKGLIARIPAEETNDDGTHTSIKLIRLTDEGKVFDPEAPDKDAE